MTEVREAAPGTNPVVEFAAILQRRKGTLVLVFLLVTAVVAYVAKTTPLLFEAQSSLMVRIGREYVYRPEVGRNETARTPSLSEMVNSEVEILNSHDLAQQVVQELGVETLYPGVLELEPDAELAAEMAVVKFRKATSVRPVLESSVIKVSVEHTDPQVAADAVNLLVERFKDKHLEVFGEERSSFLDDQFQERKSELTRAEAALADFKRENNVFDLSEQRVLLLGQRVRLDEALRAAELALAEARARLGDVPTPGDAEPQPSYLRPEMKDRLVAQLHTLEDELRSLELEPEEREVEEASLKLLGLELQESELLRDYEPTNRRVVSVRAEIGQVRAYLDEARGRAGEHMDTRRSGLQERIGVLTRELEALVREEERDELRVLELRRDDLSHHLADLDERVRTLDQQERTMRQLERELSSAEDAVRTYHDRVEEARITEELDREKRINVRVIERASRPSAPTGLTPELKMALGAFVGLIAGAGAALFLDLFRAR